MKKIKIVSILVLVVMFIGCSYTFVQGANLLEQFNSEVNEDDLSAGNITILVQRIVQIISYIGSALSVIVIVVIGIKYMLGSAEEKAEYKKTLTPYVVGCIIIFSGSAIVQVIYNLIVDVEGKIV